MYSQRVINKKLEEYARKGILLHYYTLDEVNRAKDHFESLSEYDAKGEFVQWKRPLEEDEILFQRNEALLCQADFHYASSRYAKILGLYKKLIGFVPNVAQRIKLDIYAEMEEREIALFVQALKARQLGSSTLDELIIWHRATFIPNTNAVVGSSDPTKSAKMFQMVERAWQHTPHWLRPTTTRFKSGEFYNFDRIDSSISIQHGTQRSGIGRGDTPNVVHLSEIVDFDDPKQLIDASLMRAAHEIPDAFVVLESTANGRGDWWHQTWMANKENQAKGIEKMTPIFLPWFVGTDVWPTDTWLRRRPVPPNWKPQEATIAHAVRAADYVEHNPIVKKYLCPDGGPYVMPVQQMWFYEVDRIWHTQKGELNVFLSEMPASDDEAFQSKAGSIFPIELISDRRSESRLPKVAYSIEGDDISSRLTAGASQRDASRPVIGVTYDQGDNRLLHYRFFPLQVDTRFDPMNKLCVWEEPEDNEEYEIAIDTAHGIGEDRTVIQVGRRGTPRRADAQVAEWCSSEAGALDIVPHVLAIGRYFTSRTHDGRLLEPRITIEMAAGGQSLQQELRKRGWRSFYINNKMGTVLRPDSLTNPQIGWTTSSSSRLRLLDHLIKVVKDGLVEIRSPWLVDELADLQRSEKSLKIEAGGGAHDDRLMAFAIMSYVMYDLDPRGEPSSVYRQRREDSERALRAPEWQPAAQDLMVAAPTWDEMYNE